MCSYFQLFSLWPTLLWTWQKMKLLKFKLVLVCPRRTKILACQRLTRSWSLDDSQSLFYLKLVWSGKVYRIWQVFHKLDFSTFLLKNKFTNLTTIKILSLHIDRRIHGFSNILGSNIILMLHFQSDFLKTSKINW